MKLKGWLRPGKSGRLDSKPSLNNSEIGTEHRA